MCVYRTYVHTYVNSMFLQMFHGMCHSNQLPGIVEPDSNSAFLPTMEAATNDSIMETTSDPSLATNSNEPTTFTNYTIDKGLTFLDNDDSFVSREDNIIILDDSLEEDAAYKNIESVCLEPGLSDSYTSREIVDLTIVERDSPIRRSINTEQRLDLSLITRDADTFNKRSSLFFSDYFEQSVATRPALVKTIPQSSAQRSFSTSRPLPLQKPISSSVFNQSVVPKTSAFNSQLGYVSSSVVKNKTSSQLRMPVKSLDLGFEDRSRAKVLLRCNDRSIRSDIGRETEEVVLPLLMEDNNTLSLFETEPGLVRNDSLVPSSHMMMTVQSPQCKGL